MSFPILFVRTGAEPRHPLVAEPGDSPSSVQAEPDDGTLPRSYRATDVVVAALHGGSTPQPLIPVHDTTINITVTDSRVALACSRYQKGGGWRAFTPTGLAVAAAANVVSHAATNYRNHGKMLVGHVRYDWLARIECVDRSGWGTANRLLLLCLDPTGSDSPLLVDITLDKQQAGSSAADFIARSWARHNAKHPDNTEEESAALLAAVRNPIRQPTGPHKLRYTLPVTGA